MGHIVFQMPEGTGSTYNTAAKIEAFADGAPADNDSPGRLSFYTTGDGGTTETEWFRIDNEGEITIFGATGSGLGAAGTLVFNTNETSIVNNDILGSIEFKAGLEDSGTDAVLTAAAIRAEAKDTFAADNNKTDLVFLTGASEAAAEKMRLTSGGVLEITGQFEATSVGEGVAVKNNTDYTGTAAETYVLMQVTTGGNRTFTLPAADAAMVGKRYTIKHVRVGSHTNTCTIGVTGNDNIDGNNQALANSPLPGEALTVVCVAADEWILVGSYVAPP